MVQLKRPKPFFLESGSRAVLLLHGFTGNSVDVRRLGQYLNKRGYTCFAPIYAGHGGPPEALLKTGPNAWWHDVEQAMELLKKNGYTEIAVCGLSLGGVFSLKCGYTFPVKGIIPMCAPAYPAESERLIAGAASYARTYKQYQGKSEVALTAELNRFKRDIPDVLTRLGVCVDEVAAHCHQIKVPAMIVQARNDEMIDPRSANFIYDTIQSRHKQLKWYENSTHVITLGTEKERLHQDIDAFLESLDWSVS
ncbi:alpha/beta hydrolase [Sporolactobacillus terrae]|uniref:alpha/beta hydrolase n=1 Tax=Sporolactobacillus terrae TaxID=269673 RepID=UPI00048EAAE0|nr:alpha/beta fold hydrolase [Sporolactobacillus terrae]